MDWWGRLWVGIGAGECEGLEENSRLVVRGRLMTVVGAGVLNRLSMHCGQYFWSKGRDASHHSQKRNVATRMDRLFREGLQLYTSRPGCDEMRARKKMQDDETASPSHTCCFVH